MPARRPLWRVAFALLAMAAVVYAARTVWRDVAAFRASPASFDLHWTPIGGSIALVFGAYAALIETWRRVVCSWGGRLTFPEAARIWFISNLGRYLPGKVWQLGAMAILARQKGVTATVAAGSALVINAVNLVAGFLVVAVTGARLLEAGPWTWLAAGLLVSGLATLPASLPWLIKTLGRLTGQQVVIPPLSQKAVWIPALGCAVAWVLYGCAFRLLVTGLLGEAPGGVGSWIAVFSGSYLLGYIWLIAPGGIGVREQSLVYALERMQLATAGGPGVVALASRLWLTVLEIAPGLAFLLADALWRRRPHREA